MRKKENPQIRIRMSPEKQKYFQKLAIEAGMDFSEWIGDRLTVLADDTDGTAAKIAEMVVAIWRIVEVKSGQPIPLQSPLAAKAMATVARIFDESLPDVKTDATRIRKLVQSYTSLRAPDIVSIGKMLRVQEGAQQ